MRSEDQSRELLQLISEGFLFVDGDFRVTEINAEGVRMAQRPVEQIVGRLLWDIAPQLCETEVSRRLRHALETRGPVSLEHFYTWADGRQAWLEVRAFPSAGGLAVFYRNISHQKQSEEELKRAQAELVQASRTSAMGTMGATLAHELAQPLTSVANYVEASLKLLRPLPAAEAGEARRALGLAAASIKRASEILQRLRSFVAKGKVEAENQDLQAIIADAGVLMLPLAQREGVEIDFRLDRHARWVKADDVQIQQVLVNLIKNAIEAMRGVAERRITVATALLPSGKVEISIADSGPGFHASPGELFAPFHSSKSEGLGVGLSISRTIVEAHGGTIAAESPPDGGAAFRFTLPRGHPAD